MHGCRPCHCFIPPYLLDRLARADDPAVRDLAVRAIANAAAARATRATLATMPAWAAVPSPAGKKQRLVYDARHQGLEKLPGRLVRAEGGKRVADAAVNEAYAHSGTTYDFYRRVLGRNSLDDRGMALISSVHLGRRLNNAFWTGEQMCYGDGDGRIFLRFTRSLDVVGHELTHGVIAFTCNLEYQDESGALNEHFADVFGALVRQWRRRQSAADADWLVAPEIMGPGTKARALRCFTEERAFEDDPLLGTDPQPKHLRDRYLGGEDNGGVHINSGIPNHAFYLAAAAIGGRAWEKAGRIWYDAMRSIPARAGFGEMADLTAGAAGALFGAGSLEQKAVRAAWKKVGV